MSRNNHRPIIKPQWRPQLETVSCKLDTETIVQLKAYCDFIQSEQSYVIREMLNYLFTHDELFQHHLHSTADKPTHPAQPEPGKPTGHSSLLSTVKSKATASDATTTPNAGLAHANEKH